VTADYYRGPVGPDGKFIASMIVIFPTFFLAAVEGEILVLKVLSWTGLL
jgi:hypothetical protein